MNDPGTLQAEVIASIATFGDHVHVYLTENDWAKISQGNSVTVPLAKHPTISKITISHSPQSFEDRGTTQFEDGTLTLMLPKKTGISGAKEINVEVGWHRNYVIRLEGWKNEVADWSILVENIRKKYLGTLQQ